MKNLILVGAFVCDPMVQGRVGWTTVFHGGWLDHSGTREGLLDHSGSHEGWLDQNGSQDAAWTKANLAVE